MIITVPLLREAILATMGGAAAFLGCAILYTAWKAAREWQRIVDSKRHPPTFHSGKGWL